MAVVRMYEGGGGSRSKTQRTQDKRQNRFSDALAALTAMQAQQAAPPPMPEIPLPPLPSLPPPQPVRVEDPVAMLSRAVAALPGLPTINTLQTLASLAESTAQNLLQSRLAAQEQALQQALGLGNLALDRARLQLEQLQEQRLRQQMAEEARQEALAREETLRSLALQQVRDIIQTAPDQETARDQIEVLRSIFPELRYILTDAMIEQAVRTLPSRAAAQGQPTQARGGGGGIVQHFRMLPQAMWQDLVEGGRGISQALSNLLHRLSFDYVMGHRR